MERLKQANKKHRWDSGKPRPTTNCSTTFCYVKSSFFLLKYILCTDLLVKMQVALTVTFKVTQGQCISATGLSIFEFLLAFNGTVRLLYGGSVF